MQVIEPLLTFQNISDIGNLPSKNMSVRKGFLVDTAKYFKGEPHQISALEWLQSQIPDALLDKFADEYSPQGEQDIEPKASKYQLRFRLKTANTSELIIGVLEFIRDGVTYNKIQATSSLPGRQFNGSWTRKGGLIPPTKVVGGSGLSVKTTPIFMPNVVGVSGNFYQISPFTIETSGATRGDFGVHFDANTPGSLGCICPVTKLGWEATQREFKTLAGIGIRSIELIVEYI